MYNGRKILGRPSQGTQNYKPASTPSTQKATTTTIIANTREKNNMPGYNNSQISGTLQGNILQQPLSTHNSPQKSPAVTCKPWIKTSKQNASRWRSNTKQSKSKMISVLDSLLDKLKQSMVTDFEEAWQSFKENQLQQQFQQETEAQLEDSWMNWTNNTKGTERTSKSN
jgi:hypothetical protein